MDLKLGDFPPVYAPAMNHKQLRYVFLSKSDESSICKMFILPHIIEPYRWLVARDTMVNNIVTMSAIAVEMSERETQVTCAVL